MIHGQQRNRRIETTMTSTIFETTHGDLEITYPALEQSVSERYCEVCGDWQTAKGIIGAMICPVCYTEWKRRE